MSQTALVLDDDMLCRTLLCEILRARNIDVTSFSDPSEYFEATDNKVIDSHFDFILTDNQMPGMTGMEFLQELKRQGVDVPHEHLAIISGSWSGADLEMAREIGCQVFTKPYEIGRLYKWLDS